MHRHLMQLISIELAASFIRATPTRRYVCRTPPGTRACPSVVRTFALSLDFVLSTKTLVEMDDVHVDSLCFAHANCQDSSPRFSPLFRLQSLPCRIQLSCFFQFGGRLVLPNPPTPILFPAPESTPALKPPAHSHQALKLCPALPTLARSEGGPCRCLGLRAARKQPSRRRPCCRAQCKPGPCSPGRSGKPRRRPPGWARSACLREG